MISTWFVFLLLLSFIVTFESYDNDKNQNDLLTTKEASELLHRRKFQGSKLGDTYVKILFEYVMKFIIDDEFFDDFAVMLMELLLESDFEGVKYFQKLVEKLVEFVGEDDDEGMEILKERFFEVFFAKFMRFVKENGQPENDGRRIIGEKSVILIGMDREKMGKLFEMVFEQFFRMVISEVDKDGGESNQFLIRFVETIYSFFKTFGGVESGEDVQDLNQFIEIMKELLFDFSRRRILREDCLPIEIDESKVKCKRKKNKVKCEVEGKSKREEELTPGVKAKIKEEYEYEEKYEVLEGKTLDDIKKEKDYEDHDVDLKEDERKNKIKYKEEHYYKGYEEILDDEGNIAVLKYKVECEYKYEERTFLTNFVDLFRTNGDTEEEILKSLFDYIEISSSYASILSEEMRKSDTGNILPRNEVDMKLVYYPLKNSLDEMIQVKDEDDFGTDVTKSQIEDPAPEFSEINIYEATDFTLSLIILICVGMFLLGSMSTMICCSCCFIYHKCSRRRKNVVYDGYSLLNQKNEI